MYDTLLATTNATQSFIEQQFGSEGFPATLPGWMGAQPAWDGLMNRYDKFFLCTSGSLLVQGLTYIITGWIPPFVFPRIPFLARYKIQQEKDVSLSDMWKCFKLVVFSHTAIFWPLVVAMFHYGGYFDGLPTDFASMAPWYVYAGKMALSLYIEDTYHYFAHRALHSKFLYKHVHKQHHTFKAPFAMVSEYAHPIETAVLGLGFFIPCLLMTDHLVYFWLWLSVRSLQTADAHLGYDLPLNPFNLLPGYRGSARRHDFHHMNTYGNYASSFSHWDWIFGTDEQFKAFTAKTQQKPKSQ
eukprot:TRINITY_DN27693_c0_g1_i1.p1 TRINITY_DN27693_c0_g1~~TRINITY_DN27693_c0_g1_i1.p1  ORF type:complete len:309 (-),score=138.12 TRINITY_DN27693_c0_g1_i1:60-953(-)